MHKIEIIIETDNAPINCIMQDISDQIREGHLTGKKEGFYQWDIF